MGETPLRQLYWRAPAWVHRAVAGRRRPTGRRELLAADRLADRLTEVVPPPANLLMVHCSLTGVELGGADGERWSDLTSAMWLLARLRELVGADGTLCMPTHPRYDGDPGYMYDKSALRLHYSVANTASRSGLVSELLRRRDESLRSHHPLSPLAVGGPLAAQLLENNLNERMPLPHGVDSSYHRFCQAGGTVVSIGIRLIKALTIIHVAEEVADDQWPVPNFFYQRRFDVSADEQPGREVVVRERRPEFVRSLALLRVRRDLLDQGILRESDIDGVPLDTADAAGVLQWFTDRQRRTTYPYVWPRLAAWGRPPRA